MPANKGLSNAKLQGTYLSCCDLSGVNLRSADIRGANLSNAKMKCVNLTNAKLHSARLPAWSSGLLEGVKLAGEEGVCVFVFLCGTRGGVSVGVCIGVSRLLETRATRS